MMTITLCQFRTICASVVHTLTRDQVVFFSIFCTKSVCWALLLTHSMHTSTELRTLSSWVNIPYKINIYIYTYSYLYLYYSLFSVYLYISIQQASGGRYGGHHRPASELKHQPLPNKLPLKPPRGA